MALHAQMCWKNLIGIARVRLIILDQSVKNVNFENRFILLKVLANQSRVYWSILFSGRDSD
jgi:hypothetical protein